MLKKPKQGAVDREAEENTKSGLYGLAMMFLGALIAVMVGVALYLSPFFGNKTPELNKEVEVTPLPEQEKKAEYEFYELLPEQQFQSVPEGLSTQKQDEAAPPNAPVDVVVEKPADTQADEGITVVEEEATYDEPADNTQEVQISASASYILQIRSYDTAEEADRRRAEVIMAGVDAEVVRRHDGSGNLIYQVVTTPFASKEAAMSAYQRLQNNGIDALVVEQRR